MVCDFQDVKRDINSILQDYDHTFVVERQSLKKATIDQLNAEGFKLSFVDFRTTAENFAFLFYSKIRERGYNVTCVTVYETPNCSATYEEA